VVTVVTVVVVVAVVTVVAVVKVVAVTVMTATHSFFHTCPALAIVMKYFHELVQFSEENFSLCVSGQFVELRIQMANGTFQRRYYSYCSRSNDFGRLQITVRLGYGPFTEYLSHLKNGDATVECRGS
jgi:hypothetical protein